MSRALTVPVECPRGHELTARTTWVATAGSHAVGWECLRCLRVDLYKSHYGRDVEVPAELLDADRYLRQRLMQQGKPIRALSTVVFESGWGFEDPDPTPELRAERHQPDIPGHVSAQDRGVA